MDEKRYIKELLDFSDEQYNEHLKLKEYDSLRWKLYAKIVSETMHNMTLIEVLFDEFISTHMLILTKNKPTLSNKSYESITLKSKYNDFKVIISNFKFIDKKAPSTFKKIENLIKYRNILAHSSLDINYSRKFNLHQVKTINLKYVKYNNYGFEKRSIPLNEHKEKIALFVEVHSYLKSLLVQSMQSPHILLDDRNHIEYNSI